QPLVLGRRAGASWHERRPGPSAEHGLHLVEEALRHRVNVLARERRELLEQLSLSRRQLLRRLDDDAHELVAGAVAVQIRHAAAAQTEHLARLCPGRYLHLEAAVERRDLDLGAERGLGDADRHLAHEVRALAREDRMLLDVEHDVEVTRRPAVIAGLALAAELQPRAGVDAGGDLHVDRVGHAPRAGTLALRARVGDDLTMAVALPARLRDREEPLLEAHLSGAVALGAGLRRRPRLGTASPARLAAREARHRERFLAAATCLDERDLELVLEVGTAACARATTAGSPGPEEVAEQVTEDVVEARGEVEAAGATLLERGMPEPIVLRAALGIGQDLVGLVDLFEALFGLGARIRILVRVILEGELSVGSLELLVVGGPGD